MSDNDAWTMTEHGRWARAAYEASACPALADILDVEELPWLADQQYTHMIEQLIAEAWENE